MRKFGVALAALGTFLAVSLWGSAPRADEQKPLNITFIIYTEAGNVFWNPALRGVQDAAKAFNANVDIQYADADPVKQNNIIETAIANKVDGIALTIFVPDAFTKNIQKARDAGIGVVAFNIDDPKGAAGSARQAFVGQDLSVAG
jgi:simple sugar transport system substrate-binding protein